MDGEILPMGLARVFDTTGAEAMNIYHDTLRDVYAGQALQGALASMDKAPVSVSDQHALAVTCFDMANAMILHLLHLEELKEPKPCDTK